MRRFWGILLVLSVFCLAGCGKKEISEEQKQKEEDKIQIGMSFDSFVVERWQRDRDVFVSTASELGAEVNIQNANGDAREQITQLEYFIDKNVDVIVVVPIEADGLSEVIHKAKEKGIKVISYDRLILNAETDLYVSFDNEAVGSLMGRELTKRLKKGDQVLFVCGPQSDNNVAYVEKGAREKLEEKGIEVLDTVYVEGWKAELAADYISENMDKVQQADAILCGNDDIAGQVVRVLSENRLAGSILVTGQDADLSACQRIVEGTQCMTVYKPVEQLAKVAAEAAVALAKGEIVETEDTISDNTWQIPFRKLEPLAVTSENMDAIIVDSGFHLKEDIYLDRPNVERE